MVLRTITGARTPVCLLTAIASVEAVTPPSWRRKTKQSRVADTLCGSIKELLPI
jgi:hypothetical protein